MTDNRPPKKIRETQISNFLSSCSPPKTEKQQKKKYMFKQSKFEKETYQQHEKLIPYGKRKRRGGSLSDQTGNAAQHPGINCQFFLSIYIIRITIRIISVLCLPFTVIVFFVSCIVLSYKYQNQCLYCNITQCTGVNIIRTMFWFKHHIYG